MGRRLCREEEGTSFRRAKGCGAEGGSALGGNLAAAAAAALSKVDGGGVCVL